MPCLLIGCMGELTPCSSETHRILSPGEGIFWSPPPGEPVVVREEEEV